MTFPDSLTKWLVHIEGGHPEKIDLGLDRVIEVGAKAKVLHFTCPVVTVAGTNGKGSTVASLASLLLQAGLKVGTYTSPHLFDFKERVQINGKMLDDETWCQAFTKIESYKDNTSLTFFEFTTLAAFEIFQTHELDIIILEVGLGGELDAVNVITPSLAIVTSIGLDHQDYLGQTIEEIAFQKAGIFRPNQPAVIGRLACVSTLLDKAQSLNVQMCIEGKHFDYDEKSKNWLFGDKANILIKHYLPNSSVALAMAAYTILDNNYFSLPRLQDVVKSIENKVMVGRCYPVNLNNRLVIFDVAHNPQGSSWLASKIKVLASGANIGAVWASMADKDLINIAKPLRSIVKDWYIGKVQENQRCARVEDLEKALLMCHVKSVYSFHTINEAFEHALNAAHDLIVVFGSFFTVSQVMHEYVVPSQIEMCGISGMLKIPTDACLESEC
ncbi:MAG: folylpolyglutamate synthase/dihydrofolate synthase family protein [Candidatus Berkiella sp.]